MLINRYTSIVSHIRSEYILVFFLSVLSFISERNMKLHITVVHTIFSLRMEHDISDFSESYLVAEQKEIAVKIRNDPVLSCRIIPRMLDRTVHYCRWIRPDGYGIYNDISHRYTTNSSYTLCRLVILSKYI